MANVKNRKKYYFSVEGQTEQWYLKRLEYLINSEFNTKYIVSLDCAVKNPIKRVKSINIVNKTEIWHLFDYEGEETKDVENFKTILDNMKKATSLGKNITYKLGYSNLTFDLWIVMHKVKCYNSLSERKQYLSLINRAFGEKFQSMKEYKKEENFKRCLRKISLDDVISAVEQGEDIMKHNFEKRYILQDYKGYNYFRENPSLSIHEIIRNILKDCELM